METNNVQIIDSIERYNELMGFETKHPLVAVVDVSKADFNKMPTEGTTEYEVYALWLKQTMCGDLTYGRLPYDYQEGTVTSFAPGQVVKYKRNITTQPRALGLLFHPDLIRGTSLGQSIKQYQFFAYTSREALHLSEEEKEIFKDCLQKIQQEIDRPVDSHSKKLICRNIELLLDYCMRFYERQFITRKAANRDVIVKFDQLMDQYFEAGRAKKEGIPSVKYFAEECFLSPNYFGDLIKKETGKTPQEHIQSKIIDMAKDQLAATSLSVNEIADHLGFQYSQHFNRYFKRNTGVTPLQYRAQLAEV